MRVEPATTDDVDDLADAWVALAETQRRHGSHLAGGANRREIRSILAYHAVSGTCLVARAAGESTDVVGFVNFGVEEAGLESDVVRGIVHNVYVDPDRRGEGIGSALLAAAEAALAERGADVVAIEALADNEGARRLYRRRGYDLHRVQYEREVAGERASTGESDTNSREGS